MTAPRVRYDTATAELDPPLAVVDLDAFAANAAELCHRAGGRPIRVATKSVRCPELLRRTFGHPGFAGTLCYSLREALWLVKGEVTGDALVGYPTADRAALRDLAADEAARSAITLLIDDVAQLDLIEATLGRRHPRLRVCLELDGSWRPLPGMHVGVLRSPVRTARQARALAREVHARRFRLVGLMSYEAQVAGVGDAPPGQPLHRAALRLMRERSMRELAGRRAATVEALRQVADLEFVNGGGTGSLELTAADRAVTELTAGSGLLGPTLFDHYRAFRPRPAAVFALPVVRRPGRRVATVFAGGYVASGVPGEDRLPVPVLPGGLRLTWSEGAGEVQTPVSGRAAAALRVGDRVWFRHAKAGELAEHFPTYHLVEGDRIVDSVPTYRGAGQAFG
ncbi:alanine racemase [Longimycelium tulufanense]|uniref:Alanine racemase n=1 Tax=Longimycelium tulufanense TaxID=907463 RepID=A0A8J3FUB9_9PSEU|nr:amino acid deaminase/aldolase [Longimycelium tulufanense]GGM57376.1 alanine racemase [Longimycelium tulufanense]